MYVKVLKQWQVQRKWQNRQNNSYWQFPICPNFLLIFGLFFHFVEIDIQKITLSFNSTEYIGSTNCSQGCSYSVREDINGWFKVFKHCPYLFMQHRRECSNINTCININQWRHEFFLKSSLTKQVVFCFTCGFSLFNQRMHSRNLY